MASDFNRGAALGPTEEDEFQREQSPHLTSVEAMAELGTQSTQASVISLSDSGLQEEVVTVNSTEETTASPADSIVHLSASDVIQSIEGSPVLVPTDSSPWDSFIQHTSIEDGSPVSSIHADDREAPISPPLTPIMTVASPTLSATSLEGLRSHDGRELEVTQRSINTGDVIAPDDDWTSSTSLGRRRYDRSDERGGLVGMLRREPPPSYAEQIASGVPLGRIAKSIIWDQVCKPFLLAFVWGMGSHLYRWWRFGGQRRLTSSSQSSRKRIR